MDRVVMRRAGGLLVALLLLAVPASAQDAPRPSLDVQRFMLIGSYHNFVLVHDGVLVPKMKFGVDVTLNYAFRPLQQATDELSREAGVIDHLFAGHVRGAFAPTNWVEIDLILGFMQFASAGPGIVDLGGEQDVFSLGDIWLEGRFKPLSQEKHFVNLGVIPFLTFPTGNPNLFLTSGIPTFGVKVAVSRRWKRIHAAGHIGYRLKVGHAEVGDNVASDDEILYAVGFGVTPVLDKLDINLELNGVGIVGPGLGEVTSTLGQSLIHSPLELMIDARIRLPRGFDIIAGAGPGLTAGVGTPAFRVFAGFSWAPPRDKDGDGILDPDDSCVDEPEDFDSFEDDDGCPEVDNDGDGIVDADDKCPLDPEDGDGFEDDDGCPELDNDADGIPDAQDACVNDPEDADGFEDADGCPELDNDADGVLDVDDGCPMVKEDFDGFQDEDGCPESDNDGDGFPDDLDLCPDQPENVNDFKDDDGCPDDVIAVVSDGKILILDKILFVSGKDRILKKSYPVLEAVNSTLLDNPAIKRIRIEGHTDDKGRDAYNQGLSEKRANAIMRYLVKAGIDPERLVAVGYGETRPIDTNKTENGRERNRRVEFTILEQDSSVEMRGVDR
jgi:outer membrane protein OmpA-like peptidoglycan-associated protein